MNKVNTQLIVIISIFILLFIALFFFVARPRYNALKIRYQQLSEAQVQLESLIAKKEALLSLKKDQKRIESALTKAQSLLPEEEQTSGFLVQLEAGISDTGNKLKNITFPEEKKDKKGQTTTEETKETGTKIETTEKKESYKSVDFSVTFEGNFKQLLDLLVLSETLSRFNGNKTGGGDLPQMSKKAITYIIVFIVLILIGLGSWRVFIDLSKLTKVAPEEEKATKIDYKELEKIEALQNPGQPISIDEPGYGRENPFAPY